MKFSLIDGVERNAAHPNTFHIPDDYEKNSVMVGDYVKLIFTTEKDDLSERMWVKVDFSGRNHMIGTLDNEPFDDMGVHLGDEIHFEKQHIIDILKHNS